MNAQESGRRSILHEIAGGLGDVGVFIPLALALVIENGFNLKGIFLAAGLFYITAGCYFRVPMPVQPLKAMAVIALASGFSQGTVQIAGLIFGCVILLLLIPGASNVLGKLFPLPVIRGIQLALGIILVITGLKMAMGDLPLAFLAVSILIFTHFLVNLLPPLLPVLLIGVIISVAKGLAGGVLPGELSSISFTFGLHMKEFFLPITALVIPQLGLTVGNSIVATVQTSKDIFPKKSERVTVKSLALSIGIGNILSALLGGFPMCHGSGGLTAHHRFGARSNMATAITGVLFLSIALLPSGMISSVLFNFPLPFLGVPLVIVGIFHALFAREILMRGKHAAPVIITALVSVLTRNLTAGVALGFIAFRLEAVLSTHLAKRKTMRME